MKSRTAAVQTLLNFGVNVNAKYGANVIARGQNDTSLHIACRKGNSDIVRALLNAGADVSNKNNKDLTALDTALKHKHDNIFQMLCEHDGLKPDALLFTAVRFGNVEMLKKLLDTGIDVSVKDSKGLTPIQVALENGQDEVFHILYQHPTGSKLNLNAALLTVSKNGHGKLAQSLINYDANVEAVHKKSGSTPLHHAASRGRVEVVKVLINAEANLESKNKEEQTPLMCAALKGHREVVEILTAAGAHNDCFEVLLFGAANSGDLDMVQTMDDISQHVEIIDKDGHTPLLKAALNGHENVVYFLLDKNANVNAQTKSGLTGLHLAAKKGHYGVVQILVQSGANKNAQNKSGNSALYVAAGQGNEDVVRVLLAHGVEKDSKNNLGWSPLFFAASAGNAKVVKALIESGADIETTAKDGGTPLLQASADEHLEIVQILVDAGANLEVKNNGYTALHWASMHGHLDVVKILITAGANKETKNEDGLIHHQNKHKQQIKHYFTNLKTLGLEMLMERFGRSNALREVGAAKIAPARFVCAFMLDMHPLVRPQ